MAFFFIYDKDTGSGLGWGTVHDDLLPHHFNQIREGGVTVSSEQVAEFQLAGGAHYFRWDGKEVLPKTKLEVTVTGDTHIIADGESKLELSWSWPKPIFFRVNNELVGPFTDHEPFTTLTPGRYRLWIDDPEVWSETRLEIIAHEPESVRG